MATALVMPAQAQAQATIGTSVHVGTGVGRIEACKAAVDKTVPLNRANDALGARAAGTATRGELGACDCAEVTNPTIPSDRWKCMVRLTTSRLPADGDYVVRTEARMASADNRIDACKSASNHFGMAANDTLAARLNGTATRIELGSCDCGEKPSAIPSDHWSCMVVAKEIRLRPLKLEAQHHAQKEPGTRITTHDDFGATQAEACIGAKDMAGVHARSTNHDIVGFGECYCSNSPWANPASRRWQCGVEASIRPKAAASRTLSF